MRECSYCHQPYSGPHCPACHSSNSTLVVGWLVVFFLLAAGLLVWVEAMHPDAMPDMGNRFIDIAAMIVALAVAIFIYFIPAYVGRKKRNAGAIFVLNTFLGWTFLGWVIALVWASAKDDSRH